MKRFIIILLALVMRCSLLHGQIQTWTGHPNITDINGVGAAEGDIGLIIAQLQFDYNDWYVDSNLYEDIYSAADCTFSLDNTATTHFSNAEGDYTAYGTVDDVWNLDWNYDSYSLVENGVYTDPTFDVVINFSPTISIIEEDPNNYNNITASQTLSSEYYYQ